MHQSAPGGVDDIGRGLHQTDLLSTDEVVRFPVQHGMQGNKIRSSQQIFQIDHFHESQFQRYHPIYRVIGNDLHVKAITPAGHFPADTPHSDDTNDFFFQIYSSPFPRGIRPYPAVALRGIHQRNKLAGQGHQQGKGMVGNGSGPIHGAVAHGQTVFVGSLHVDRINPHTPFQNRL